MVNANENDKKETAPKTQPKGSDIHGFVFNGCKEASLDMGDEARRTILQVSVVYSLSAIGACFGNP
jgi:hypothetical protein